MERIEVPEGTTYRNLKLKAGMLMTCDPSISSVRILVQKETNKICIEIKRFPQETIDKLELICYNKDTKTERE